MKTITYEWFARAEDDLLAAEILLTQPALPCSGQVFQGCCGRRPRRATFLSVVDVGKSEGGYGNGRFPQPNKLHLFFSFTPCLYFNIVKQVKNLLTCQFTPARMVKAHTLSKVNFRVRSFEKFGSRKRIIS